MRAWDTSRARGASTPVPSSVAAGRTPGGRAGVAALITSRTQNSTVTGACCWSLEHLNRQRLRAGSQHKARCQDAISTGSSELKWTCAGWSTQHCRKLRASRQASLTEAPPASQRMATFTAPPAPAGSSGHTSSAHFRTIPASNSSLLTCRLHKSRCPLMSVRSMAASTTPEQGPSTPPARVGSPQLGAPALSRAGDRARHQDADTLSRGADHMPEDGRMDQEELAVQVPRRPKIIGAAPR